MLIVEKVGECQMAIGLEGGITKSVFSNLNERKNMTIHGIYEIDNRIFLNQNVYIDYQINKKWTLGTNLGLFFNGFNEKASFYFSSLNGTSTYVPFGEHVKGIYEADYTTKYNFSYWSLGLRAKYLIKPKLIFFVGFKMLFKQKPYWSNGYTFGIKQKIINLPNNGIYEESIESDDEVFSQYHSKDKVIEIGIQYNVWNNILFQISFLKGFDKVFTNSINPTIYNQAININAAYGLSIKNRKTKLENKKKIYL